MLQLPSMRPLSVPLQALSLAAVGAAGGLLFNGLREGGIPLDRPVLAASGTQDAVSCEAPGATGSVSEVDVVWAFALREQGAVFVDARPPGSFADGHVAGAVHLPWRGEAPDAEEIVERLRAAPVVVVYDAEGSCFQARHLASVLAGRGIADVRVMLGGFPEWQSRGKPSQSGVCEACDELAEVR